MNWIKQYKWGFWWAVFGAFVFVFIIYIIQHISKNDFNAALLQFGSILIPLFAAIIIMLQNNELLDASTKMQIDALAENTNRQIEEFRKLTNEQIKSLQENTNRQIQSYTEQTEKIVNELTDNSVLLGEILKRELEKAILQTDRQIEEANNVLKDLMGFKIGRPIQQKELQIQKQNKFIEWLKNWRNRLHKKYQSIMNVFKDEPFQ